MDGLLIIALIRTSGMIMAVVDANDHIFLAQTNINISLIILGILDMFDFSNIKS